LVCATYWKPEIWVMKKNTCDRCGTETTELFPDKQPDGTRQLCAVCNKPAHEIGEEPCRCKEVSRKTPGELFKLALRDLKFWK